MGKSWWNIQLNEVYESKVVNIADYGVFVDLGDNIEGLIRTSELDWTNKNISPKKVLSLGDNINVKVVEIDEEKKALNKYGSSDSGASLGDILGSALDKKNKDNA